jgi:Glycosyl hydrolase family 26
MTELPSRAFVRRASHRKGLWALIAACFLAVAVAVALLVARPASKDPLLSTKAQPMRYLGVYERNAPRSYGGVKAFTTDIRVKPDVLLYFSTWLEPFQVGFATVAAKNAAVPLVQIDPTGVNIGAIAAGQYDSYLNAYAKAVRSYGHPVILSFGHEMNGNWYSWGYQHTSPQTFVAAWRHIVNLFRGLGVRNVTWMWTVNIMASGGIPSPAPWWPGKAYVNWVGLDGYYYKASWTFTSLFGPTIGAVRELTSAPILIAETGASPAEGQSAKIANLFAGIHLYGVLGFVWFDVPDWHISSQAAIRAFRQGAKAYYRPSSAVTTTNTSG